MFRVGPLWNAGSVKKVKGTEGTSRLYRGGSLDVQAGSSIHDLETYKDSSTAMATNGTSNPSANSNDMRRFAWPESRLGDPVVLFGWLEAGTRLHSTSVRNCLSRSRFLLLEFSCGHGKTCGHAHIHTYSTCMHRHRYTQTRTHPRTCRQVLVIDRSIPVPLHIINNTSCPRHSTRSIGLSSFV